MNKLWESLQFNHDQNLSVSRKANRFGNFRFPLKFCSNLAKLVYVIRNSSHRFVLHHTSSKQFVSTVSRCPKLPNILSSATGPERSTLDWSRFIPRPTREAPEPASRASRQSRANFCRGRALRTRPDAPYRTCYYWIVLSLCECPLNISCQYAFVPSTRIGLVGVCKWACLFLGIIVVPWYRQRLISPWMCF